MLILGAFLLVHREKAYASIVIDIEGAKGTTINGNQWFVDYATSSATITQVLYLAMCYHTNSTTGVGLSFNFSSNGAFAPIVYFDSQDFPTVAGQSCSVRTISSANGGFVSGTPYRFTLNFGGGGNNGNVSLQADDYVRITTDGLYNSPATTTQFIEPYIPANGSLSTSTTVLFQFQYNFNDSTSFGVYDTVSYELTDVSSVSPSTYRGTFAPITSSGISTFNGSSVLIAGHLYLWRPVMYSFFGSTTPIYGDFYSLDVVSRAGSSTQNTAFIGATVASSTLPDATNLLSFLNVPQLLQTKIPFGYFFEAKDAITAGLNSSSTTAIPTGGVTYRIGNGATSTVELFGSTTMHLFLSDGMIASLRQIMVFLLYIEFIWMMYHRAKSKHLL